MANQQGRSILKENSLQQLNHCSHSRATKTKDQFLGNNQQHPFLASRITKNLIPFSAIQHKVIILIHQKKRVFLDSHHRIIVNKVQASLVQIFLAKITKGLEVCSNHRVHQVKLLVNKILWALGFLAILREQLYLLVDRILRALVFLEILKVHQIKLLGDFLNLLLMVRSQQEQDSSVMH